MAKKLHASLKYIPIIFIIFWTILLFGKTLLPPRGQVIYGGDLLTQFYFWKNFLVESIKSGFIPFWNPYNFSGTPALAHPSAGFFYPSFLLFLLLPINIAFSFNYFIHFMIAGIGMYHLGKKYTNVWGGLAGALVFISSGFFSSRIYAGHVEILSTVSWIPWVILMFEKYFKEPNRKNFCLFIFVFSLELLAGYQIVTVFTLEFILFLSVYKLIRNNHALNITFQKLAYLAAGILISVCITGIYWIPTSELVNLSIRSKGLSYDMASWGAISPSGFTMMFINPFDKTELGKLAYGFGDNLRENFFDYYLGIIPLLLIIFVPVIIFIQRKIKRLKILSAGFFPDYLFLIISTSVFFIISFAYFVSPNIHLLLFKLIPLYRLVRIPDQHLIMAVFILSLATGIIIGSIRWKFLQMVLIVVAVIPLFIFSREYFILTKEPQLTYSKELIDSLNNDKALFRLLPDYRVASPVRESFESNLASYVKVQSATGYDPVILSTYYKFISLLNKEKNSDSLISSYHVEVPPTDPNSKLNNFLNIKYIIVGANWENVWKKDRKLEKVNSNPQYALYKNNGVLPRFYFVPKAKIFGNLDELENALIEKPEGLKDTVYLLKNDAGNISPISDDKCNDKSSKIDITSYNPNQIILTTDTTCEGFLSTSEVYYPGWKATIDDKEEKILRSNISFRSIMLPKGKHTVRLHYSPDIYFLGGLVSLGGLVILLISINPHFIIRSLRNIRK